MSAFPVGPFQVISADPPWMYQKRPGSKGQGDGPSGIAEREYPTMTNEEIAGLPVAHIAAPDAHLFLWFTNPGMFGGRFSDITPAQIAAAWGFEYRTTLTWVKTTKSGEPNRGGMGWYFRGCTEHVLYATRGRAKIPAELREPNLIVTEDGPEGAAFFDQRGRHSAKPPAFYDMVDRVIPGVPRLELFARDRRPGWDAWGNEVAS